MRLCLKLLHRNLFFSGSCICIHTIVNAKSECPNVRATVFLFYSLKTSENLLVLMFLEGKERGQWNEMG